MVTKFGILHVHLSGARILVAADEASFQDLDPCDQRAVYRKEELVADLGKKSKELAKQIHQHVSSPPCHQDTYFGAPYILYINIYICVYIYTYVYINIYIYNIYLFIVIFQFATMDASTSNPTGPIGNPTCIPGQVKHSPLARHCGSGAPWWEGSGSV